MEFFTTTVDDDDGDDDSVSRKGMEKIVFSRFRFRLSLGIPCLAYFCVLKLFTECSI